MFRKGLGCFSICAFHHTDHWNHRYLAAGELYTNQKPWLRPGKSYLYSAGRRPCKNIII